MARNTLGKRAPARACGFESHLLRIMNQIDNLILIITDWIFLKGIKILAILVIAWIITKVGRILIKSVARKSEKVLRINGKISDERRKTIFKVFNSTFSAVVWTIAILTVLSEININIGPLLAGAGIAGLAIGMGARSLIQDYISGLFILIEDQYRVGEDVIIVGTRGFVFSINLRRTVIKDKEGVLHTFPNGQINKVSNFSRK